MCLTNWVGWFQIVDCIAFKFKHGVGWYDIFHGIVPDYLKQCFGGFISFSLDLVRAGDDNNRRQGVYILRYTNGVDEGLIRVEYSREANEYSYDMQLVDESAFDR
ncbi:MAG: hypothetical protein Q7Q73_14690 [Verrucomicrobiota bacterium JB024]|nr:hypothetical protein [Verrucomicrobiota bacterium JB024]